MRKLFTLLLIVAAFATVNAQVDVLYICLTLGDGPNDDEAPVVEAIQAAKGGDHFNVTVLDYNEVYEDNMPTLNDADVVIVGRSVNSGDVINDPQSTLYREITAPVIHTSPWVIRGDRLGYVTGGTEHQNTDETLVVTAVIQEPSHPVFEGITDATIEWTIGYTSNITPETGDAGGTVLATTEDGRILAIIHEANVPLPANSEGRTPLGPRAYMGNGQDNVTPATYWNYADPAKEVFFNLIDYMASLSTDVETPIAKVAKLNVVNSFGEVSISAKGLNEVEIYSLTGQLVSKPVVNSNQVKVTGLSKGIYVVKANVEGASVSGKFSIY